MSDGYVVVIGSAGIDVKAAAPDRITEGTYHLGRVRNSGGGVARNIAENLARLDITVVLLSAVGDDGPGKRIARQTSERGVNCRHVRRVRGGRTSNFVSMLREDGDLWFAVSDYEIMRAVNRDYLLKHEPLLEGASMVVIDATLSEEALATVFELADKHGLRVCADPTAPYLADRLCPYLDKLFLLTPNASETAALCAGSVPASDRESAIDAARALVGQGTQLAVVTMGELGVAYADGSGGGFIRALRTHVVDPTGAGDAFSAAVIFGLLNDVEVDEAMRLGMTAAALTLQTNETVYPDLSQELLYAKLVV